MNLKGLYSNINKKVNLYLGIIFGLEEYNLLKKQKDILSESYLFQNEFRKSLDKRPNYIDYTTETTSISSVETSIYNSKHKINSIDKKINDWVFNISEYYKEYWFIFATDSIVLSSQEFALISKKVKETPGLEHLQPYTEAQMLIKSTEYIDEIKKGI